MKRFAQCFGWLATTSLIAFSQAANASNDQALEAGLLDALRYDKAKQERVGDSGKAIQAYMREGLVNNRPNQRIDYTDYYLLNKPAKFLGQDLVMIEEEYMSRYILET